MCKVSSRLANWLRHIFSKRYAADRFEPLGWVRAKVHRVLGTDRKRPGFQQYRSAELLAETKKPAKTKSCRLFLPRFRWTGHTAIAD